MDANKAIAGEAGSATGTTVRVLNIKPVPKPRMTQRDKWKKRPAVMRYREFCDQVREAGVELPETGATVIFYIGMPKSWTKNKRALMDGGAHQQKPDVDNLCKALMDAVFCEDQGVWDIRITKIWAQKPSIVIKHGA